MQKDKPKRLGRQFPVTFVVDQQLEACVHAIGQNPRRSNVQIDLHDEHNDADRVDFSAALFHDGIPMTHVWGTLRRWQGTSTRVEGHARTLNSDLTRSTWWAAITFTIFVLMSGFLMLLNTVESHSSPPTDLYWVFALPFFPVVLYVGVILLVGLFNATLNKRRLTQRLRKLFQSS